SGSAWPCFTGDAPPAAHPPRRPAAAHRTSARLARPRQAVGVEAVDERAARDAEQLGGAGLVAAGLLERLEDAAPLERLDLAAGLVLEAARGLARRPRGRRRSRGRLRPRGRLRSA